MPLRKRIQDMIEKYELKYPDAATMAARLTAVRPLMIRRRKAASSLIANVNDVVRNVLENKGVPASQRSLYYKFGREAAKLVLKHSGATLIRELVSLEQKHVAVHKADPVILDEIITALLGAAPPC